MISVVIVTYNSAQTIEACLASVNGNMLEGGEVIVVDNASQDTTVKMVKGLCPEAVLIENRENKGSAAARNQGIARARNAWVLTLDSDVVLDGGFMKDFLAEQGRLPDDVGMVQPNILSRDRQRVYSQGIYLSLLRRFFDVNQGKRFPCENDRAGLIIGPCSAAAFYRRDMLERVRERTGYFDERFFFLVEDVDLAWRAKRAGWKVAFRPELIACHEGDGSQTSRGRRQYLCWRNRHWMIAKNETFSGKAWLYPVSLPYEIARGLFWLWCYCVKGA
jgi:GT2 family glycosyltransferase